MSEPSNRIVKAAYTLAPAWYSRSMATAVWFSTASTAAVWFLSVARVFR